MILTRKILFKRIGDEQSVLNIIDKIIGYGHIWEIIEYKLGKVIIVDHSKSGQDILKTVKYQQIYNVHLMDKVKRFLEVFPEMQEKLIINCFNNKHKVLYLMSFMEITSLENISIHPDFVEFTLISGSFIYESETYGINRREKIELLELWPFVEPYIHRI